MNWKTFLVRLGGLIVLAMCGFVLHAVTTHLLIMLGLMPTDEGSEGFGKDMTHKAMYVFMASIPVGFAGIFIKDNNWRRPIYLCPLYAASLFAFIHTITHN